MTLSGKMRFAYICSDAETAVPLTVWEGFSFDEIPRRVIISTEQ
jgi:hypothetical protein